MQLNANPDRLLPRWSFPRHGAVATALAAAALVISAVTVGGRLTGMALVIGSLGLAAAWFAFARWCGVGVKFGAGSARAWGVGAGIGVACGGAFAVGAFLFWHWGWFAGDLRSLTLRAEDTSILITLIIATITGIAEETAFRGTVYSWLIGQRPLLISTLVYAAAMAVNGTPALVVAAVFLGLAAGWARHLSESLLAPVLVHLIWTLTMVLLLPNLVSV